MTRLHDILLNLAERTKNDVEYVEDTRSSATSALSGTSTIVSLTSGTRIAFHTQYNISDDATMTLTLKDNSSTTAIPVYKHGNARLNNFSFAGAILPMTYIAPYLVEGTTVASAAWVLDGGASFEVYNDDYVVIPDFSMQTLETNGLYMHEDVRVASIPVYRAGTADTDGYTVTI